MTFQLQTPKIAFGDIQLKVGTRKLEVENKWDCWKLEVETNVFLEVGS